MIKIIITGRAGAGKSTIIKELMNLIFDRDDISYTRDAKGFIIRKNQFEEDSENSAIVMEVPIKEMIEFDVVPVSARVIEIECSSVEQKNHMYSSNQYKGLDIIAEMAKEARLYFTNLHEIRQRIHTRVRNPEGNPKDAAQKVLNIIEELML